MNNNKILTISIAAYNVEKYIQQTLDSLLVDSILDDLEVLIVDDGSTDSTAAIAKKYQDLYPDTFQLIKKENGGYGSTVNCSLSKARGKYFKLLDGDDWFDQEGLEDLIRNLKDTDADIVVTPYTRNYGDGTTKFCYPAQKYEGKTLKIEDFYSPNEPLSMWTLTYKVSVIKASELQLPLHRLYSDLLFNTIPFTKAETITFLSKSVYQYRLGRDEQSVSRISRIKHYSDAEANALDLARLYTKLSNEGTKAWPYLKTRIEMQINQAFRVILLSKPTVDGWKKCRGFDLKIKDFSPELYKGIYQEGGHFLKLIRGTGYLAYWMLWLYPNGYPNWD